MSEELKPCPLCGGTTLYLQDLGGWEISCLCGINLCNEPEKEKAVARWNTSSSLRERVKELESALKEVINWYEHANTQDAEMNRRIDQASKVLAKEIEEKQNGKISN
jgi:hypothetical protein